MLKLIKLLPILILLASCLPTQSNLSPRDIENGSDGDSTEQSLVLTHVSNQTVQAGAAINEIDVNLTSGLDVDGEGTDISYSCFYDLAINRNVSDAQSCSNLGVSFDSNTGVMNWTPSVASDYEFKIVATNGTLISSGIFYIRVNELVTETFSCLSVPQNATICAGSDQGLSSNTTSLISNSCSDAKCEYVCNSGYELSQDARSCVENNQVTNQFISVWKTEADGVQIEIPMVQKQANLKGQAEYYFEYDYTVDWGDGSDVSEITSFNDPDRFHTYETAGEYQVTITGKMETIHFFDATDPTNAQRLLKILNLGDMGWVSFAMSFANCSNLTELYGGNTSNVENMYQMFFNAYKFNSDLSHFDTSKVTNMSMTFYEARDFNGNVSNWNVSNVTHMVAMFQRALDFNQDLTNWDTSKVINMNNMFAHAESFNGNIGNWNTSKVQQMKSMFEVAKAFNSPIGNWDTSKVKDMSRMFVWALNFNQDISNWNTSKVMDMNNMFYKAEAFNQSINSWDTSKVQDMNGMFFSADMFNQNLNSWDTSNVKDMHDMFVGAYRFNGNISNWNTSQVRDMSNMFSTAEVFNQDISSWDTSKVENMSAMFSFSYQFNQDLSSWNVRKVTNHDNFDMATASWQESYKPQF